MKSVPGFVSPDTCKRSNIHSAEFTEVLEIKRTTYILRSRLEL